MSGWMDGYFERVFGGFRQSRPGRYGLEEFVEVKTLTMRVGRSRANWVRG